MTKLTFEKLAEYDPNVKRLEAEPGCSVSTTFWEDLYQLFKSRMLEEQSK